MGFSACSAVGARSPGVDAVGARSDGVDGANACVACSSTYAAAIRMITQPGGSPVCRSVHAFDANAAVQELTQCPVICKTQTYLFNSSKHARQRQGCACLRLVSYMPLARYCRSSLLPAAPQPRRLLGYSSVGRARSRPWKIGGEGGLSGPDQSKKYIGLCLLRAIHQTAA